MVESIKRIEVDRVVKMLENELSSRKNKCQKSKKTIAFKLKMIWEKLSESRGKRELVTMVREAEALQGMQVKSLPLTDKRLCYKLIK